MDLYRSLVIVVAQWMQDANMEPNKGSATVMAEKLQAAFGNKNYEIEPQSAQFYGAAWQAVEYFLHKAAEQEHGPMDAILGRG